MAIERSDELPLLTVAEVAKRLRVHPITVRRLIKSGRLRVVRIGRAVRIRADDLDALLSSDRAAFERGQREVTEAEWERRREAARKLLELRDSMPPMDISTTDLVRRSRAELEQRDKRRTRSRR
jgi:excisionase family DNA binding protein